MEEGGERREVKKGERRREGDEWKGGEGGGRKRREGGEEEEGEEKEEQEGCADGDGRCFGITPCVDSRERVMKIRRGSVQVEEAQEVGRTKQEKNR